MKEIVVCDLTYHPKCEFQRDIDYRDRAKDTTYEITICREKKDGCPYGHAAEIVESQPAINQQPKA